MMHELQQVTYHYPSLSLFVFLETFYHSPSLNRLLLALRHNIPFSDSARNLGFIDSKLSMKKHVIKICQTAYFELRRISSIRRFLTEDANKTLVASYILSRLDYCNCLLLGTANSVIQPLRKIQNFAARLVLLAPRHHHSTPLLEKLHWLPILERIKSKVACMCFSAMNGSGPAYLSELLHVYTPSRTLRSSSNTRMLEIQQCKRKIHGFHTFSCFGPVIWNSLPQDLRHCSTLSSFKAKLKTFLFSQYFHPNLYQYPVSATVSVCACVRACVRACVNESNLLIVQCVPHYSR